MCVCVCGASCTHLIEQSGYVYRRVSKRTTPKSTQYHRVMPVCRSNLVQPRKPHTCALHKKYGNNSAHNERDQGPQHRLARPTFNSTRIFLFVSAAKRCVSIPLSSNCKTSMRNPYKSHPWSKRIQLRSCLEIQPLQVNQHTQWHASDYSRNAKRSDRHVMCALASRGTQGQI